MYRGIQKKTKKSVVCKIFEDEGSEESFDREVYALTKLNKVPNVSKIVKILTTRAGS